MTGLNTLREQRAAKIDRARALSATAERENRDLNDSERREWDALKGDIETLDARIDRRAREDAWDKQAAGAGSDEFRDSDLRGYSLAKAIGEAMNGSLTGLEREVNDEYSRGREGRNSRLPGFTVPAQLILEARALTTTTPVGGPGGNLVATDLAAMADRRRPAIKVEGMGATVIRGLTGNVDMPQLIGSGNAHWVAENANTTGSDATFAKKSMGPKTVSAQYGVGRRMMLQSSVALEPIMRADLGYLLAQALDGAAIMGGGANEPVGILSDAEVDELTGAALSADLTADLIAALELDDVTGTRAFLTHPNVMAAARKIKEGGTGRTIPVSETFHGERVEASTQVPSTLGTAPANNKAALIYGEWASLYVGYWSGVDILVNPYHADVASKGGALLHAFLDADVLVRHPEAFRWAKVG